MPQRLAQQARRIQQQQAARQVSAPPQSHRSDLGPRTGVTSRRPAPAPARPAPSRSAAPVRSAPAPVPAPAPVSTPAPVPSASEQRAKQAEEERKAAETRATEVEKARAQQLKELEASIQEQPLDPSLIAAFEARQRAAGRSVQEAEVAAQRGREQAKLDFEQFLRQLGMQTQSAVGGLRGEAAARNLAFQPAFVGVGMRDIRDDAATAQASAQQQRAQFLTGIDRQIQQAQQMQQEEIAAIARDRTRAEADHRAFIERQIAALRG